MKTMAPDAPTSHTIARCNASTPGAAVIDGREPPAVAAYAITHSRKLTQRNKTTRRITCVIASEAKQSMVPPAIDGLLRYARNDGEASSTQYAFSLLVISASGVLSRM